MNENMILNFENNEVKIINNNGKPLFEIYSTGMALGYIKSNTIKGKTYYQCRKDRVNKTIENIEIKPLVHDGLKYITEEQLYDFMLEAKTDKCRQFRKWITNEVLPQIARTGGFIPLSKEDNDAEIMAKALMIAQKTLEKKDELIENLTPKANWYDDFMNSNGLYTSTQVAKLFKFKSAQQFNKTLNENRIIFKQGKSWFPYSEVDKTWFKVIVGEKEGHNYSNLKITPKGIMALSKILKIEINKTDLQQLA